MDKVYVEGMEFTDITVCSKKKTNLASGLKSI